MKLDRKGFMLAEVIVVSVVIAAVLITLFTGLRNVSLAYEIRNKYYDVDSLYAAMEINDILVRENTIAELKNQNDIDMLYQNRYEVDNFINFYKSNGYDISKTFFIPYSSGKLNEIKNYSVNQTFKDYVDYLNGHLDFDDDYDYMIIVERQNNSDIDDCYYYALKLKY